MNSFIHVLGRRLPLPLLLALGLSLTSPPPLATAAESAPLPKVWPTPRHLEAGRGSVAVPERVVEVVGEGTDPAARRAVEAVLRAAGAERIVTVPAGHRPPPAGLTVYVGGPKENADTGRALKRLGAASP